MRKRERGVIGSVRDSRVAIAQVVENIERINLGRGDRMNMFKRIAIKLFWGLSMSFARQGWKTLASWGILVMLNIRDKENFK